MQKEFLEIPKDHQSEARVGHAASLCLGPIFNATDLIKILHKISASILHHAKPKESYTTVISIIVGNVKRFNTRTNYFIYPPRHSLSHSTASVRLVIE